MTAARKTTSQKKAMQKKADNLPAEFMDQLAGNEGLENADSDCFSIPFIRILQKMSPALEEDSPGYIEGAKPGQFLITATDQLFDSGDLKVIPVHFRRAFLEWTIREEGGGFIAEYPVDEGIQMMATTERDEKNRDILPGGHELQDTRIHYLLALTEDGPIPCVLSCARTQIKGSKDWLNKINQRKLPNGAKANSYAQVYTLNTVKRSNDQGAWYVLKAVPAGLILDEDNPQELYQAAMDFREMILGGRTELRFDEEGEQLEEERQAF